ncbi:MAG: substrate-binding domain-containing protein, partial [Planctomycetota bacterium]
AGPAERPRALGGQRAVLLTGDPRLAAAGTIAEILGLGPRVSAADRDSAAIGRFLAEALPPELHARFEAAVRDRGVTRATVEAAANDVALGVADAAIVWDRVARRHPRLSASVPEELATRSSRWGVAVLRDSTRPELAEAFVAVLADVADGPR